jgi:hypothetical protein
MFFLALLNRKFKHNQILGIVNPLASGFKKYRLRFVDQKNMFAIAKVLLTITINLKYF